MSVSRKASRKYIRFFQQFLNFVPPKIFLKYWNILMRLITLHSSNGGYDIDVERI